MDREQQKIEIQKILGRPLTVDSLKMVIGYWELTIDNLIQQQDGDFSKLSVMLEELCDITSQMNTINSYK